MRIRVDFPISRLGESLEPIPSRATSAILGVNGWENLTSIDRYIDWVEIAKQLHR